MTETTTNLTRTKAPFRADHVGSFLRPATLKEARAKFAQGEIDAAALRQLEDQEIARLVEKQEALGLNTITDGELRRSMWHIDFLAGLNGFESYEPEHGYFFKGVETRKLNVRNIGPISFNTEHPFLADFAYLYSLVSADKVAKFTIPSPNQLLHVGIRDESIYPDVWEFVKDIQQAYRDAIQAFYDLGCRNLQIDDCYWGYLCSADWNVKDVVRDLEFDKKLALATIQGSLEGRPADLVVTTHVCRGNYASTYAGSGPYTPVAKELFGETGFDGFFLEYDTDRAGDFSPLQYVKDDAQVVLGLITSKFPELETEAEIRQRVEEATQYVPLEQLCLSPQCGFASTEEGNHLTEEEQWAKVSLIVDLAAKIWGE